MIKIGGLQKMTMIDYPGKIAATVFLIGCNFKCGFCHNSELVCPDLASGSSQIPEDDFFKFLNKRKELLEGICITGGEPTINFDLSEFIKKIKEKGFLVKLDTNGSNPEMLEILIKDKLIDFIAMDIKTSLDKYEQVINVKIDLEKIKQSIEIIKNSGVDYEFRTTVVPGLVEESDIKKIGKWLKNAKKFVLQQFRNQRVLNKEFEKIPPYSEEALKEFKKDLEKYIEKVELRI